MRRVFPFFPDSLTVHEKLDRLMQISPDDGKAIEVLITETLKYRWPAFSWWPKRGRPCSKPPESSLS